MKGLILQIPTWLLVGWMYFFVKRQEKRGRRSPFNENMLRSPGHSARKAQLSAAFDLLLYMMGVFAAPYFFASFLPTASLIVSWLIVVLGMGVVSFCFYKSTKALRLAIRLHLGVDAERVSGQELNLLMRDGAWVFHDIPYQYGNIDHVVIASGGVFAVETKGISKPTDPSRSGADNAALTVIDGTLILPHGKTRHPIEQAKIHANWLSQEIQRRFGLVVHVQPVVAIPGWMIKGGFNHDCWVVNPKRGNSLRNSVTREIIEPEAVSKIAAWVEDLARSVEPKSKEFDPKSELSF